MSGIYVALCIFFVKKRMRIAVIADKNGKEELLAQGLQEGVLIDWLDKPDPAGEADACIDLLFVQQPERIALLDQWKAGVILVNEVSFEEKDLPARFIRFNGWRSFLKRPLVEMGDAEGGYREQAEKIMDCFHKKTEWVGNHPGFVSARVVSMIINEAYLGLEEKISTREEIDTAMKLGTGYPYGPFEWGQIVGIGRVYGLLKQLAKTNPRYQPSVILQEEAETK